MSDQNTPRSAQTWGREARELIREAARTERVQPLAEAIRHLARASEIHPDHGGDHAEDIGSAYLTWYDITGGLALLERALPACRFALESDTDSARRMSNLGLCLVRWFEHTGQIQALDEAVELLRAAVTADETDGRPARSSYLSNLGLALTRRAEETRDVSAAGEAVEAHARAVRSGPGDAGTTAAMLSNLGMARMVAHRLTDDSEHLAQAIGTYYEAVALVPEDHPYAPGCLAGLGDALTAAAETGGAVEPRIEAIEVLRSALVDLPDKHPDRPVFLSQLAACLRLAFARDGDTLALTEAVACRRDAVSGTPVGHHHRWSRTASLALALRSLYEATGDVGTLHEGRELLTGILRDAPEDHADRARWHGDLAGLLHRLGAHLRSTDVLAEAATLLRRAATSTGADHPDHSMHLSNLASLLTTSLELAWDPVAFDEAAEALRQVARKAAPSNDINAGDLLTLGRLHQARYRHTGADDAGERATDAFASAARATTAPVGIRAMAGQSLGHLHSAAGRHDSALAAYRTALELLDLVAWRGLDRADRERLLTDFTGLGNAAAASALATGSPEQALTLLEQGRGVLIGQVLDDRANDSGLEEAEPELAAELRTAHEALERIPEADRTPLDRQRLALQRDDVLERVRARPDFAHFLRAPDPAELREAALHGPLVTLNLAASRCDALITTNRSTDALPLPDLTATDAVTRANTFIQAVNANAWGTNDTIRETLAWLWDTVTAPVLDRLGIAATDTERLPHVWWMPTGALSVLPLHAAGHHRRRDGESRSALHRAVSSYTPTIRMLRHIQQRALHEGQSAPALVVAIGSGPTPLPHAVAEAASVASRLTGPVHRLLDAQATRRAVVDQLVASGRAHFVCHATTDTTRPSAGFLQLADGRLRIRDIAALRAPAADTVYLSACTTALGSSRLPDEVIHLSAAFHLTGFRHTIGTLWRVPDRAAAQTADLVYGAPSRTSPAYALNRAARTMRSQYRVNPYEWAAFAHSGSS
ncbi:CHAT domain-containing protein [Streptomyces sp. NBC_01261]|uniref:CHAT domain-containing tetratricopeptide repeat protein n=1 Tax=Streptomyces sp. NBC_01261 TaxID=2903802 RepID=UPI002E33DA72|nr:CHAT domain-containing protein [Streptomyces sp. NBC_01261]